MAIEDTAVRLIEFIENEMPAKVHQPAMRVKLLTGALKKKRDGFDRIPSFNALSAATSRRTASELASYMTLGIDTNAIEDVKNDNLSIKGREDVRIFHVPNWSADSTAEVKPEKAKELNRKHVLMYVNAKGVAIEKLAITVAMERGLLTQIDDTTYLPGEPSGALLYVRDNKTVPDSVSINDSGVRHVFNTYKPPRLNPKPHPDQARGMQLDAALNVVLNALTQEDQKQIHYVMAWMSELLTNKGNKNPTLWAMLGGGGIGKTTIGGMLLPALVGKHNTGFFDATMLAKQFFIEPFVDRDYAYGDELELKGDMQKANFKRIIKSVSIGGERKYVGALNYDVNCSIAVSMNNEKFDLRTSGTSDMSGERSLYTTIGWDEEGRKLSMNEFTEWRTKHIQPSTDIIRGVVLGSDQEGLEHYYHQIFHYEHEPRLLEDNSSAAHLKSTQAVKMLHAPVRVLIRLIKNNAFGNGVVWGTAIRDEDLKQALQDFGRMDANFDVSVNYIIAILKRLGAVVDRNGAYVPTMKRGTLVKALNKAYNINITDECGINDDEYGEINPDTVEVLPRRSRRF